LHAHARLRKHYRVLIETPGLTLLKGIRQLNSVYTQALNRQRRSGHFFQGRFKVILQEKNSHLLERCHYVGHDRVRAGLAAAARGCRRRR